METEPERTADGRDARWEEHRSHRRRQIVDAAVALIERAPIGAEVRVRQVAEKAGLARAVIYRHFTDRAELEHAVQERVLEELTDQVYSGLEPSGSIEEIIGRVVRAYVDWAAAHPALHRLAAAETNRPARAPGGEMSQLELTVAEIGSQISALINSVAGMLDVEFSEADRKLVDPLVFGLVGQVFGAVRFWLARPVLAPDAETLAANLASGIWFQLDGHARARGIVLDPTVSLEELVLSAVRADGDAQAD